MVMEMKAAILRLRESKKKAEGDEQPQAMGSKGSNIILKEETKARSPRISRDFPTMRNVENINRTPSPATVSRRKRGLRGSLFGPNASLPLGGSWISTTSFDAQEEQQLDSVRTSLVLDPVEHTWMIMVAEGNFEELQESLQEDPSLVYKKDFVTGYSILHWMAKHGHHEDLIKLMDFAGAHGYPLDINTRASGGLTPLHIASLQGHGMLIKVLVGAYSADIHARDHNGRKAWQYLRPGTSIPLLELLGAPEEDDSDNLSSMNINNNCFPGNCQGIIERCYDEVDLPSKFPLSVAPLRNIFKNAYSFFKKW
ncbi:ankyrin repeat domain-containing protein SOWAHD isoform 1-T2 [Discoglossus pictus]